MDVNKFFKSIDRKLGLSVMRLEKYFPMVMEVLTEDTLSVMSQFVPYTYTFDLNLSQQKWDEAAQGGRIYYLNDPYLVKHQIEVISVETVQGTNTFTDWNQQPATFNIEDIIIYGASTGLRSQINLSFKSFDYLGGNQIRLVGFNGYDTVKCIVKIPYPNFGAVPQSLSINFERLALLDIKIALYSELKHFDKLETADGTIDLKIDDWADAQDKRDELLDNWFNKAIPNQALGGSGRIYNYE